MKKFESSRLSEGNKMFPTQVIITEKGVVIKKPGVFSSQETTIPFAQVTQVNINTPLIGFSYIEFGTENFPISVNGFTKSEVSEMKSLVLKML